MTTMSKLTADPKKDGIPVALQTQNRGTTSPAPKQVDQASAAAITANGQHSNQHHKQVPLTKVPTKVEGRKPAAKPKAKAKKPAKAAKKVAKRGDGPSGKAAEILRLASRPQGASREELNALTKWSGAPWKWLFKNPKGTGFCDRHKYSLRIAEGKEGKTRYHVAKR
jgi:hypothetical protein